jgi:hypothetical protein
MLIFAVRLNLSDAMCNVVAGPTLAMVNSPGLARASFRRSASVRYDDALLTTMNIDVSAKWQIGSKARGS